MPTAVARLCVEAGCTALVTHGPRCSIHKGQHERARGTRTERGYDNAWLRLVRIAVRAQPWCSNCGTTADLTGDHIVPLSKGGANVMENVRVLCRRCNSRRGNHEG